MSDSMKTARDVNVWQTLGLRLTIFSSEITNKTEQTWWETLFGGPPDKVTKNPKQLSHVEEGEFDNVAVALAVQLGRVDWRFNAITNPMALERIPTIGNFSQAMEVFLKPIQAWLGICPPFSRLAFGTNLFQPTEGHIDAYKLLSSYLPSVTLSPESSDFSYQINRRRNSKLEFPNLRINRLMKWNALRMELKLVSPPTKVDSPIRYSCALEMDINTVPECDLSSLSRDRYIELLNELVGLAEEIASKGDIP
jgi:hypothetical protein